ncbi:MAG: hypothetical protein PHT51_01215 [Patescibacteria group bacterium]|nr:hypothetical protein [Patescibacteria group bacterium]MDD4610493.1 hypothetical protein [Patescibacteria group bacterium]
MFFVIATKNLFYFQEGNKLANNGGRGNGNGGLRLREDGIPVLCTVKKPGRACTQNITLAIRGGADAVCLHCGHFKEMEKWRKKVLAEGRLRKSQFFPGELRP